MRYTIKDRQYELEVPFSWGIFDNEINAWVCFGTEKFLKSLMLTECSVNGMYVAFIPPEPLQNFERTDIEAP